MRRQRWLLFFVIKFNIIWVFDTSFLITKYIWKLWLYIHTKWAVQTVNIGCSYRYAFDSTISLTCSRVQTCISLVCESQLVFIFKIYPRMYTCICKQWFWQFKNKSLVTILLIFNISLLLLLNCITFKQLIHKFCIPLRNVDMTSTFQTADKISFISRDAHFNWVKINRNVKLMIFN